MSWTTIQTRLPDASRNSRRIEASPLVELGASLPVIAAALGHRNPRATLAVYAMVPAATLSGAIKRAQGGGVEPVGTGLAVR